MNFNDPKQNFIGSLSSNGGSIFSGLNNFSGFNNQNQGSSLSGGAKKGVPTPPKPTGLGGITLAGINQAAGIKDAPKQSWLQSLLKGGGKLNVPTYQTGNASIFGDSFQGAQPTTAMGLTGQGVKKVPKDPLAGLGSSTPGILGAVTPKAEAAGNPYKTTIGADGQTYGQFGGANGADFAFPQGQAPNAGPQSSGGNWDVGSAFGGSPSGQNGASGASNSYGGANSSFGSAPSATPTTQPQSTYQQAIQKYLDLNAGLNQAQTDTSNKVIPLDDMTGQKAHLNSLYGNQLDSAAKLAELTKPISAAFGSSLVDPATGKPIFNSISDSDQAVLGNALASGQITSDMITRYGTPAILQALKSSGGVSLTGIKNQLGANKSSLTDLTGRLNLAQSSLQTIKANGDLLIQGMTKAGINNFGSPLINQLQNAVARGAIGSGDLAAFQNSINTLRAEYAKLIGGGQITDASKREANESVPDNITPAALLQVFERIQGEGNNVISGYQTQINGINQSPSTSGGGNSGGGNQGGAVTSWASI